MSGVKLFPTKNTIPLVCVCLFVGELRLGDGVALAVAVGGSREIFHQVGRNRFWVPITLIT